MARTYADLFLTLVIVLFNPLTTPAQDLLMMKPYFKSPFTAEKSGLLQDIETGAGLGATLLSPAQAKEEEILAKLGNYKGVVIGAIGGALYGVIKHLGSHDECEAKLKRCACRSVICILNENEQWNSNGDQCCGNTHEWKCYCDWRADVIPAMEKRFPELKKYREKKENETKQNQQMNRQISKLAAHHSKKTTCDSETACKHCGGIFDCFEGIVPNWAEGTGCCPPGHARVCCTTTSTTSTTTTTTTTSVSTTTTTDEFLRCKKAKVVSQPISDIYEEDADKICGKNDRHCYVLNCTTVSSSIDGFIGFTAVWGCSLTKESFKENNPIWSNIPSKCNYFIGKKNDDMSNHDKEAVIKNANVSTHWCKGGIFWEESGASQTDAVAICKPNEHYCYVANCSMTIAASNPSLKFKVLTKWGCTDKNFDEFRMDNPEQFLDQNEAKKIINKQCSHNYGKMGVVMSNANIMAPIPVQLCKKAYLSKLLTYYESSDKSCSQFHRYCYVLNCSTLNNANEIELMTEWGCTDAKYDTDDFIRGTGRTLAQAYIGSIPSNAMCISAVLSGTNDGVVLPAPSATRKCKIGHETFNNKNSSGHCPLNADLCYAIECNDPAQPTKLVKEWGCTSNMSNFYQFCMDKKAEFGYASNESLCHCDNKNIVTLPKLTIKSLEKMNSSVDLVSNVANSTQKNNVQLP